MTIFDPQAWTPPKAPSLTGEYEENDLLASGTRLPAGGAGPEDVAVADDGSVYTGIADGRILRFPVAGRDATTVADTGGRPLGIELSGDGTLLVCDADKGLLRVTPSGEVTTLVDSFNGERFVFDETVAVQHNLQDSTGSVAITTSARWHEGRLYIGSLQEPDVIVFNLD